ncbi:nucleotidyltransferase substrate binding protein [Flavobacterium nackdongense]|uniref:Nucleotidyltransferase n=1 Tax=Flavobacterium nackdongense TaxID=2547394 RepID=A0A4P6Y6V9_9FLAO|nr:nucleotidyltransferase substrate binding protein [Flavobacterium nackdongense]QBN18231.1 nucleotidyltransferase [Flavobacterium nackdongense]
MENQDIRWKQRFEHYSNALKLLNIAVSIGYEKMDDLQKEGFVQRFEFTHELSWKLMKDYLNYQGNFEINGSRDAIREAFKVGLIQDGEVWMEMIKSRNLSSHTYDEATLRQILESVSQKYIKEFNLFFTKMTSLR